MDDILSKVIGFLSICFFLIISWPFIFVFTPEEDQVIFFDVGQGDSAIVTSTRGKTLLIDGGPDKTVLYKLGKFLPWWKRDIDAILLSHAHADHLVGILEVLKRYKIDTIILPDAFYTTKEQSALREYLETEDIQSLFISSKRSEIFDKGISLDFFHPERSYKEKQEKNPNNTSILLKIRFASSAVLFTGDIESQAQAENLNEDLQSDILKFPHHGSSDSLNPAFLKKVSPLITVVSSGENSYGHPSLRTIRAIENLPSRVLRTDKDGDIRLIFDGEYIIVKTQK